MRTSHEYIFLLLKKFVRIAHAPADAGPRFTNAGISHAEVDRTFSNNKQTNLLEITEYSVDEPRIVASEKSVPEPCTGSQGSSGVDCRRVANAGDFPHVGIEKTIGNGRKNIYSVVTTTIYDPSG